MAFFLAVPLLFGGAYVGNEISKTFEEIGKFDVGAYVKNKTLDTCDSAELTKLNLEKDMCQSSLKKLQDEYKQKLAEPETNLLEYLRVYKPKRDKQVKQLAMIKANIEKVKNRMKERIKSKKNQSNKSFFDI